MICGYVKRVFLIRSSSADVKRKFYARIPLTTGKITIGARGGRSWKVVQTVREKFTCRGCEKISQSRRPFHPTPEQSISPRVPRICWALAASCGNEYDVNNAEQLSWEERSINFRQLTYFRKVVETGSITAASTALNLAQPALGAQIRLLEDELGVELLHRHSRGVTPTTAGELLYQHAQHLLDGLEQASREVRALAVKGSQQLRLGVAPSMALLVGPDTLLGKPHQMPGITVSLVEERTTALLAALRQGQLDLAFLSNVEEQPWLQRHALLEEDLLLVTAASQLPPPEEIGFADALRYDIAIGGERSVLRHVVESEARRLSMTMRVAYEVHSLSAMKNIVARGMAATIMPYGVVETEVRAGKLSAQLIVRPALTRTLYVVCRRDQPDYLEVPQISEHIERVVASYLSKVTPWARRLL